MSNILNFPHAQRDGTPRMWCSNCGTDRTVHANAADPGPCPQCGCTMRQSFKPPEGGSLIDPTGAFFTRPPAG